MSSLLGARKRLFVVLVALIALVAVPAAQAKDKPGKYYVAIGDSLAFGYQQAKFNANYPTEDPAVYNTGYVDVFGSYLKTLKNSNVVKNFGCPGETSASLLNGGCGYNFAFALHEDYSYTQSQLDAAKAFIAQDPTAVSPITLNIGANDLLGVINTVCNRDPLCISQQAPGVIATVAANTANALGQLKAIAPSAKYMVMGLYNPLFTIFGSDPLTVYYNQVIKNVATAYGATFVDPFPTINGNEPTSVCTQIAICAQGDIHPFDNGYAAIGNLFVAASGY